MWKRWAALAAVAWSANAHSAPLQCSLSAPDVSRVGPGCERAWMDHNLRLNDLVVVGTHNSYKSEMPREVELAIQASAPEHADAIDYRHRPLPEQLDAGIRQIEIDVYHDPDGGRFLEPAVLKLAGLTLDPERRAALAAPGFKVFHVQDFDIFSSCITLKECLKIVRAWSLDRPGHAPILIMVNAKEGPSPSPAGVAALPFDEAAFDDLDREIREVMSPSSLITPDLVQGRYPTLRDAVLNGSWPTLGQARGKIMFALDEGPEKVAIYRGKRRSLEGRVFFVNTNESSPAAAYLTINDPIAEADRIRNAVRAGFIVRTRADADTLEARSNNVERREAALASGAQFISTDYFWPEPRLRSPYQVRLPAGAAANCNPVRAAERCGKFAVESAM